MINQEVKGTLAKLLATENLTVEHRKVTTASFDVVNRVLILPIWKTASNTVYDLLVGHEVGHALYTPDTDHDANRGFVNVLEDVRIEKMMKRTYPGLRKSFFEGYTELNDDDFFGVNDEDLTKIAFIDRINLWFKGNPNIQFSKEEQVWVDRAAKTETFDEVVKLAIDLYGRAEKIEDAKEEEDADLDKNVGDMDLSDLGDVEWDMQPNDGKQEQQQQQIQQQSSNQPKAPVGTPNATPTMGNERTFDETETITDEAFNQALETLIDDNCKEWKYLTIPEVDVDHYIIGHKKIQDDLREHYYNPKQQHVVSEDEHCRFIEYMNQQKDFMEKKFFDYKKQSQKEVNYLIKQFEMKKSADQYKRQATSKTGVINTQSLYKYKLTEDIFKKITVIPDGKNHGLVMFLDWSGSMSQCLLDTLKQTYNLVWFCKKANIPFRVYGFQSGYHSSSRYGSGLHAGFEHKVHQLAVGDDFRLLEFLSSRQNNQSLEKSMRALYLQVFSMNNYNMKGCSQYGLGGTPLAEAIYCAKTIVAQMKLQEKVQKVNVVCLTDGEANPMNYTAHSDYDESLRQRNICSGSQVFVLRDRATGYQKRINGSPYLTTKEIVSYIRSITDYNWIGIRLCSKSELNRVIRNFTENYEDIAKYDKLWKKEKFISIVNDAGFNEAFFMPDRNNGSDNDELEIKQKGTEATRAELNRAFKKHMSSKMQNKTILNRFIAQIA